MKFRNFFESQQPTQISRKEFFDLVRWLNSASMGIGSKARDNPFVGEFGLKYNGPDPQRTVRILKWGASQLRVLNDQFPHPEEILKGTYDQLIVPTIRQLRSVVPSIFFNFQQVGFDASQFPNLGGLKTRLDKFPQV